MKWNKRPLTESDLNEIKVRKFAEEYIKPYFKENNLYSHRTVSLGELFNDIMGFHRRSMTRGSWFAFKALVTQARNFLCSRKVDPIFIQSKKIKTTSDAPTVQSRVIKTVYSISVKSEDFGKNNEVLNSMIINLADGIRNNNNRGATIREQRTLFSIESMKDYVEKIYTAQKASVKTVRDTKQEKGKGTENETR